MSQRTLAGILALPLVVGLWLVAVFAPLPYVTYAPGVTVDVLGERSGVELIEIEGRETYRDEGELLLTTVYVSRPGTRVNLFEVMEAWIDRDTAVLPYGAVYAPEQTREQVEQEGAVQMASSQDIAVAVALQHLGVEVPQQVKVLSVAEGLPAEGVFEVDDVLRTVNGKPVATAQDVVDAVDAAQDGQELVFTVVRAGQEQELRVTPAMVDGDRRIGITPGTAYVLPVEVEMAVDPSIGGPSAGLVFALAVHDTLTPGSLTGGATVAGTGTLAADGAVGPIGGVAQKIAASREAGADLFLVPGANCDEALGARNGDMRLVRVDNYKDAMASIEAWVEDPDASLPTCERTEDQ
ncbi:PDZ domain-containing protein [Nocardioides sp. Y6]|uniref:PDZ domain-containing protein n=1 Tax=Nocardioides malaquae TaxID=2773426 RepID=A0ABR9RPN7_9ACTN|nr:PDZ domain-containing protein [Nocardioides malaquae]MBE7323541.1 PDZ domain-containing protein [Nocardioides malaquae]